MTKRRNLGPLLFIATLVLASCAPQAAIPRTENADVPGPPKRITAAINGTLAVAVKQNGDPSGAGEFVVLVNAGLTTKGLSGPLEPQLAEAVPSIENGLWKVFPDGRMETTWRLRPNVVWQDGVPITAEDFIFTRNIFLDKDLDFIRDLRLTEIEDMEAPDPQTIVVRWKRQFIDADTLFGGYLANVALPLPRHILEAPYASNRAAFSQLPFWSSEFVGAGPYKIQEWVSGSHVVLRANEHYVLGRPKIDVIEVKFIPSSSTLLANILAGEVDLTLGDALTLDQASEVRKQWRGGIVLTTPTAPRSVVPKHLNPDPAVIGNVQFRRALIQGIDRAEMARELTAGLGSVADSGLPTDNPAYAKAAASEVRYAYDPGAAARLVENIGYARGSDGMYQDASGQRLVVEIRSQEAYVRQVLAVADYWRRLGVTTNTVTVPPARASDSEYSNSFAGFSIGGNFGNFRNLKELRASEIPTAANKYQGKNEGQYVNPVLDTLVDRFFQTLPLTERVEVLGSIYHLLTDQVVVMPLYSAPATEVVATRVSNVSPAYFGNVHEWGLN